MKLPVGNAAAHLGIVEDADDGNPPGFRLIDHGDHHVAVFRIQAGGRFVKQQDRVAADEAARQVDALLLAAGKRRRRQRMQAGGDVEPVQQAGRLRARRVTIGGARRLGDDVDGGHPGDDAQELADIAQRLGAHLHHRARGSPGDVDHFPIVMNKNAAGIGAIIAIQAAQQGGFPGTGGAGQGHTFAGMNRKLEQAEAVLQNKIGEVWDIKDSLDRSFNVVKEKTKANREAAKQQAELMRSIQSDHA